MIPLDHPAVQRLAEERVRAYWEQVQAQVPQAAPWEQTPAYGKEVQIGAHVRLLCDTSRLDTRDAWVRWGIARDTAIYDEVEGARWQAACAEHNELSDALAAARRRWQVMEYREIREKWHALRDNPSDLAAAVVAALETT